MTSKDYRTLVNADSSMVTGLPNTASTMATQMSMNAGGNQPGIDISNLDFVKKAKDVLVTSENIDKSKIKDSKQISKLKKDYAKKVQYINNYTVDDINKYLADRYKK